MYIEHGDPIEKAFILGAKAGYVGTDRNELLQHLRKLSYSELYWVYANYNGDMQDVSLSKISALPKQNSRLIIIHIYKNHLVRPSKPISFDFFSQKKPAKLFAFGPSIEEINEGAVIPRNFRALAKKIRPLPTMYGFSPGHGFLYFVSKYQVNT